MKQREPEPDDVLCTLLLRWLWRRGGRDSVAHDGWLDGILDGIPGAAWDEGDRLLDTCGDDTSHDRLLDAIAAEDARLRLKAAKEALLDAARVAAHRWGSPNATPAWNMSPADAHAMATLYRANEEWTDALVALSVPGKAPGLVEVTNG